MGSDATTHQLLVALNAVGGVDDRVRLTPLIKADHVGLIKESADLLYHLNVLWAAAGVTPSEVYAELERREGKSGIVEKASRPKQ